MASATANESALARNLLNSVLALAFPEHLATDAAAQQVFLAQVPQLERILQQQNVFGIVDEGRALEKFQSKLFQLLDQPVAVLDKRVRAAAFALQLIVVQQCGLEQLEQLTPKLMDRVIKTVKFQQDATSNPALAPALDVAAVVVRNIELLTPEVRRELYDNFAKFLPSVLSQLQALGAKKELAACDVALWMSGVTVFTELLEVSPNALRIYATKLEQVCALVFQFPAAFLATDGAVAAATKCVGLLANASDKTPQLWKQIVDRGIEAVHAQVDVLSGKRSGASSSAASATAASPGTVRSWLKDASADAPLAVYSRAELVLQRLELAVAALAALMTNRSISEREVQLVIGDVVALARRALAVRATEIGKQTAVSDDGVRLPASVVYGIAPRVHALALRVLSATVERAGLCALRHASKIIKVLQLASETIGHDANAALYDTTSVCVRALGASTVEKLGVPLLDDMVARCKAELAPPSAAAPTAEAAAASASSTNGGRNNNNNKGKKRKRQAESSVAQLAEAVNTLPFVSSHAQLMRAQTIDAALAAIATCVAVYGSVLPVAMRSAATDLAQFAVQQRTKHKFLTSAAAATQSGRSTSATSGVDAVALLLLTDAASADANGAHGANVVASLQYWHDRTRHCAVLPGVSPFAAMMQLVAQNVGDALLHPRAPPLAIALPDASDAAKRAKQTQLMSGGYTATAGRASASGRSGAASGVRGRNDWNDTDAPTGSSKKDEDEDEEMADAEAEGAQENDEEEAEEQEEDEQVDEDAAADANEEDDDDEEEDYDDVRPSAAAPATKASPAAPSAANNDDDDDDEFPDIVDDEDDE